MNYRLYRLDGFLWGKIINAQAHELEQIRLAQEDGFDWQNQDASMVKMTKSIAEKKDEDLEAGMGKG